jgi:dolichol-phosphate mannosyltransferase
LLSLSRNFGKEIAVTAGIQAAHGAAIFTLDADGQHPVALLPKFIEIWQAGTLVVIGLRTTNQGEGFVKRWGSRLFYNLFNRLTRLQLTPGATDFRLIDQAVQADFIRLTERNRITRGLIDWLGYKRAYVAFEGRPRLYDTAGYSFRKLCKLAIDSVISLSSSPLYVVAYMGMVVLPVSVALGLIMLVDAALGDPLQWHATGGAYVLVLVLFLIGVLLLSQGIIGLYLSHIHSETQNRPLYIIDQEASIRL